MAPAMLCKTKNLYRNIMRTISQEKGTVHCNIIIWYTKLLMPQAMKIPAAKAAVDQEWEKLEKIQAWNLTKVRKQIWRDRWSKKRRKKTTLRFIDGHMSFEKCWIGGKAPKVQKSSCTPRRHCEWWFRIMCSIYWTRIISITSDGSKSHGYHLQIAWLRRTSSWRSICWNPGKNGRCSQIIENSQIWVSRHLDSSTTTQMAKNHGPVSKTQLFLLSGICTVILWQDYNGKGNLRKSYWNTVGRRFPIGNAYSYTVNKDHSYLRMWMPSNWLETNKTLIRCGNYSIKKSIWENQHLSSIMYFWAALKDNVK